MLYKLFNFLLSFIVLIVLSPILLLTTLFLFIYLKENPIFVQKRGIILGDSDFNIYKFKTIKSNNTPKVSAHFLNHFNLDQANGLPKWLRRTGLDELPQLINILKGEMTFIGPRPLMEADLNILKENYPQFYELRKQINCKPGISGLWQIFGKREKGASELLNLDVYYSQNKNPLFDIELHVISIFNFINRVFNKEVIKLDKYFEGLNVLSLEEEIEKLNSSYINNTVKLEKLKTSSNINYSNI